MLIIRYKSTKKISFYQTFWRVFLRKSEVFLQKKCKTAPSPQAKKRQKKAAKPLKKFLDDD